MKKHPDSALIEALGGTQVVMALCDVKPATVSDWRAGGIPEPRKYEIAVKLVRRRQAIPAGLASYLPIDPATAVAFQQEQ